MSTCEQLYNCDMTLGETELGSRLCGAAWVDMVRAGCLSDIEKNSGCPVKTMQAMLSTDAGDERFAKFEGAAKGLYLSFVEVDLAA